MDKVGFLLIDKPGGMTSAHVVNRVKRMLRLPRRYKVGHAGTLDPDATGLLVCALGRATKLIPYVSGGTKEYRGEFELGVETSTDDLAGEVLRQYEGELPAAADVLELVPEFTGKIRQIPPQVSALKINGRRAYDLAREGQQVDLPSREVTVETFTLTPLSLNRYEYCIVCSGGTYIRSIARDIGARLGVGGALAKIRRTRSEPFRVEQATPLEEISEEHVISCWDAVPHLGEKLEAVIG